jgi:hypothetical protein
MARAAAMAKVTKGTGSKSKKPWEYIGEFIWWFGAIESHINEIFVKLFDLERAAFMFMGLIDTRRKLQLIKIGFEEQGTKAHSALIRDLHELVGLRNVLAHSQFFEAEGGISIDHITHQGTRSERDYMSYKEFEGQFDRQKGIIEELVKLYDEITPISSYHKEFIAEIDQIIDSSPNVFRFSPRPPTQNK